MASKKDVWVKVDSQFEMNVATGDCRQIRDQPVLNNNTSIHDYDGLGIDEVTNVSKQNTTAYRQSEDSIDQDHGFSAFIDPESWDIVIDTMATTIHPEQQLRIFQKLKKIAEKMITKDDPRYRQLYLNNPKLQGTVLTFDGGLEFLYNLGFEPDPQSRDKLICPKVDKRVVNACLTCLTDKIETLKADALVSQIELNESMSQHHPQHTNSNSNNSVRKYNHRTGGFDKQDIPYYKQGNGKNQPQGTTAMTPSAAYTPYGTTAASGGGGGGNGGGPHNHKSSLYNSASDAEAEHGHNRRNMKSHGRKNHNGNHYHNNNNSNSLSNHNYNHNYNNNNNNSNNNNNNGKNSGLQLDYDSGFAPLRVKQFGIERAKSDNIPDQRNRQQGLENVAFEAPMPLAGGMGHHRHSSAHDGSKIKKQNSSGSKTPPIEASLPHTYVIKKKKTKRKNNRLKYETIRAISQGVERTIIKKI